MTTAERMLVEALGAALDDVLGEPAAETVGVGSAQEVRS